MINVLTITESEDTKRKDNISNIAKRYGVSMDMIYAELKRGVDIELKYTNDKQIALRHALDNVKKDLEYYINMEKLESDIKKYKNV